VAIRSTNRIWTGEDTERLCRHIEQGGSVARASVIFRRSDQAVRSHAGANGWKFPTIRELRKRASGSERYLAPQR
jgi:hypothetical protein